MYDLPSHNLPNLLPGMSSTRFIMYRSFVFNRHRIWEQRQADQPQPWTHDHLLASKKFTNVFRVLDPGSQYVVSMFHDHWLQPRDALARAILYRFTNRPQTWDHLKNVYGRWPDADDMNADLVQALHETPDGQIFSGAYIIMPTPGKVGDKALGAVALARRLTMRGGPESVVEQVVQAGTARAAYEAFRSHTGMGDFMSMQILTDWGYYWPTYDENEFVIAGPGSRRGVEELFPDGMPGRQHELVIRWVRDHWLEEMVCPIIPGVNRPPSLMDTQNTFCEFYKYMRYLKKERPGDPPYRPAHPGPQPTPLLPHHWSTTSAPV